MVLSNKGNESMRLSLGRLSSGGFKPNPALMRQRLKEGENLLDSIKKRESVSRSNQKKKGKLNKTGPLLGKGSNGFLSENSEAEVNGKGYNKKGESKCRRKDRRTKYLNQSGVSRNTQMHIDLTANLTNPDLPTLETDEADIADEEECHTHTRGLETKLFKYTFS